MTNISNSLFQAKHLFNEVDYIAQYELVNSRTCGMKFKDFQAPVLFSSTFKALNLGEKIQVLSRMRGNPALSLSTDSSATSLACLLLSRHLTDLRIIRLSVCVCCNGCFLFKCVSFVGSWFVIWATVAWHRPDACMLLYACTSYVVTLAGSWNCLLPYIFLEKLCVCAWTVCNIINIWRNCSNWCYSCSFYSWALALLWQLYSANQRSSSPKTYCNIFTHGEPLELKMFLVVAQRYSYMSTSLVHLYY